MCCIAEDLQRGEKGLETSQAIMALGRGEVHIKEATLQFGLDGVG